MVHLAFPQGLLEGASDTGENDEAVRGDEPLDIEHGGGVVVHRAEEAAVFHLEDSRIGRLAPDQKLNVVDPIEGRVAVFVDPVVQGTLDFALDGVVGFRWRPLLSWGRQWWESSSWRP